MSDNYKQVRKNIYNSLMIKNNLSAIMGAKRIKQSELMRLCNLSYETVHRLFHEKSKGIEFETLDKLCWALECTPNDILVYTEDKK